VICRWTIGVACGLAFCLQGCDTLGRKPNRLDCGEQRACPPDMLCDNGFCRAPLKPRASASGGNGSGVAGARTVQPRPAGAAAGSGGRAGVVDAGRQDAGLPDAGAEASDLHEFELAANAIVADPMRRRVYAIVGGKATSHANQLVTIDTERGEIASEVSIGSEPTTLAISEDGSTLWVGISGAAALRRVDLTGDEPLPGDQFPMPTKCANAPCAAGELLALPGASASVLATLRSTSGSSSSTYGAVVLDDGNPRPKNIDSGVARPTTLCAGTGDHVFAYNGVAFDFSSIRLDSEGATANGFKGLVGGFNTELAYLDGRVYASSGDVVDVSDPDAPRRAGKFPMEGSVLPLAKRRVLMLGQNSNSGKNLLVVHTLNAESFTLISSATVAAPPLGRIGSQFRDLQRIGPDLAFIAGQNTETKVFLLKAVAELRP
jgi:hypothetical protein